MPEIITPETIKKEFVSKEKRKFKVQLGRAIASSLSGFLAGIIIVLIIIFSFFELTLK
jgi:hypothetical protein